MLGYIEDVITDDIRTGNVNKLHELFSFPIIELTKIIKRLYLIVSFLTIVTIIIVIICIHTGILDSTSNKYLVYDNSIGLLAIVITYIIYNIYKIKRIHKIKNILMRNYEVCKVYCDIYINNGYDENVAIETMVKLIKSTLSEISKITMLNTNAIFNVFSNKIKENIKSII